MAHKWTPILLAAIAEEYGEPEQPGEHCEAAAENVLNYLETLGYTDDVLKIDRVESCMYELYLFARWQQGNAHDH